MHCKNRLQSRSDKFAAEQFGPKFLPSIHSPFWPSKTWNWKLIMKCKVVTLWVSFRTPPSLEPVIKSYDYFSLTRSMLTAYKNLNKHVLNQLFHRLNHRFKTYTKICFDTEFANTKNLTFLPNSICLASLPEVFLPQFPISILSSPKDNSSFKLTIDREELDYIWRITLKLNVYKEGRPCTIDHQEPDSISNL
jgi:hypothetical protein